MVCACVNRIGTEHSIVGSASVQWVGWEVLPLTREKKQSTAEIRQKNHLFSITCGRRTVSAQSGALENIGLRETKFGLPAKLAVRSFSQRSPQILGIFEALNSGREICLRARWRRERCWEPTLSSCKLLILLSSHFDRVRIPRADPRCFAEVLFLFIPWIIRFRWPGSSRDLHSTVRAGDLPTSASAGAEAAHALTFKSDHSIGLITLCHQLAALRRASIWRRLRVLPPVQLQKSCANIVIA